MLTDEQILTIFQQHDDMTDAGAITIGRAIEQATIAAHSAKSHDAWKLAVDDEVVTIGSTADSFDSPKAAIAALIDWHVSAALDPAISKSAQNLIDKGRVSDGAKASTLGEQIKQAEREAATWTPERRANVRLQGSDPYVQPQPMTRANATRDAKDAKRYRLLREHYFARADNPSTSAYHCVGVFASWMHAPTIDREGLDAVLDAEIERLDGAKGE